MTQTFFRKFSIAVLLNKLGCKQKVPCKFLAEYPKNSNFFIQLVKGTRNCTGLNKSCAHLHFNFTLHNPGHTTGLVLPSKLQTCKEGDLVLTCTVHIILFWGVTPLPPQSALRRLGGVIPPPPPFRNHNHKSTKFFLTLQRWKALKQKYFFIFFVLLDIYCTSLTNYVLDFALFSFLLTD